MYNWDFERKWIFNFQTFSFATLSEPIPFYIDTSIHPHLGQSFPFFDVRIVKTRIQNV